MKRFMLFIGVAVVGLPLMVAVPGCGQKSPVRPEQNVVSGMVFSDGMPAPSVAVIICLGDGKELITQTDDKGYFASSGSIGADIEGIVAVTLGKTGAIKVDRQIEGLRVDIAPVPPLSQVTPTRVTGEYWFGVYSTDGNGDVKFRYQLSFVRFTCVNYLPWIWFGSWQNPDPNSWLSWNLTGFPAPWKGKFLAVPKRLQWWHQAYYGYPIQRALYLIAIG